MTSKIAYLLSDDERDSLEYPDENYLNYVTPHSISSKVFSLVQCYFCLEDKVIWDMFCGVGTDSLRLAQRSGKVLCTEIDERVYEKLLVNVKTCDKIETYNVSCLDIDLNPDVIYFDPPWGETFDEPGFNFLSVMIGNKSIRDILQSKYEKHDLVVKTPLSSGDISFLFQPEDIVHIMRFSTQKLVYYVIKRKK